MTVNTHESTLSIEKTDQIHCIKNTIFACKSLVSLVQTMEQIIQSGYSENDIEYVHRLRVTSRRIRAALCVFEESFNTSDYKRWNKAIKKITRSLGFARDTDVQNVFLEQLLLKLPEENMRPGVDYLFKHHLLYRVELQTSVEKTLDELTQENILGHIKETCNNIHDCSREFHIQDVPIGNFIEAHKMIKNRYKEFIKLKKYVDNETAIQKHHKLRIASKRLRYTLEIFQPLYPSGLLKNKIDEIKQLQDSLGLLHDYDVWIEYIPDFIEHEKEKMLLAQVALDTITQIERGLLLFLYYIRQKRQEQFEEFKTAWKKLITNAWFDNFSEFLKYRFILPKEYPVTIAIIADIHANIHALTAVLHDAQEQKVQFFLHVGDAVGYGADPDEVVNKLRELPGFFILGNYDDEVLQHKPTGPQNSTDLKQISRNYARIHLSKENIDFLQRLPKQERFMIGEKTYAMFHGTAESMHEAIEKSTPETFLQKQAEIAKADVIITGHSHVFLNKTCNTVLFLNPGSVGRPGNHDPRAMYMILHTHPFSIQTREVDYDVASAAEAIRTHNLPEHFAQMVLQGVSLDMILDEEESERKAINPVLFGSYRLQLQQTKKKRLIRKIALQYDQDHIHSQQVTTLSLRLFDAFKVFQLLGEKERFYLECAAILHDIGWSLGPVGHHKASLKIILNNQKLPFTTHERYIIGCIARYHRKKPPNQSQYPFTELCYEDQKKVKYLAALIRVADALDASHASLVKDIQIVCLEQKVVIECYMQGIAETELKAVDKKKDLFEKIFNRTLEIHLRPYQNHKPGKSFPLSTLEQTQ